MQKSKFSNWPCNVRLLRSQFNSKYEAEWIGVNFYNVS